MSQKGPKAKDILLYSSNSQLSSLDMLTDGIRPPRPIEIGNASLTGPGMSSRESFLEDRRPY